MPSLLEALDAKYALNLDSFDQLPVSIYVPRKGPRNCIPSLLVLNDCDIDSTGAENELTVKCQGVAELDLAQNSLSHWNEIFTILKIMPGLNFLNLSFNNLSADITVEKKNCDTYPCLKNLILNATHISWKSVKFLLKICPNVEELHLSLNDFTHVDLVDEKTEEPLVVESVKKLHFTGNPITSWKEIMKLGRAFCNLEYLVLADSPLCSLDPFYSPPSSPDVSTTSASYVRSESESESSEVQSQSAHASFRFLKFLNLNNTLLDAWDDIERLSRFPALKWLRIIGCPLFELPREYTEHERRQLLIARLPNVTTLNGGGTISNTEREDAERAFIRYYMDRAESDRPERYLDLLSVHGKLDPLVNIDLKPERHVKVTIRCGNLLQERNIDVYKTVQDLKQKLEAFSKIPVSKMRLFYCDQDILGPEEMKYPGKQLYSYNISNGDEIIVDSKL
ncbi:hypothetical protein M8J77_007156 [Diaphorina citri]|nr:hypothetical protein M8J77_007156 [Diaphorina citri]